jgi:asparagine synthase (glutamine-hydrolysing)
VWLVVPKALEWDEAFKNMNDPSGRAVVYVHDDANIKA